MKNSLILTLLFSFLCAGTLKGQEISKVAKKRKLGVIAGMDIKYSIESKGEVRQFHGYDIYDYDRLSIVPAFTFLVQGKPQFLHRIEFQFWYDRQKTRDGDFDTNPVGFIREKVSHQIGYEFNWFFLEKMPSRIQPYIGAGIFWSNTMSFFKPIVVTSFPGTYIKERFIPIAVAGLTVRIKENVFFDFGLPFEMPGLEINENKVRNPALPPEAQRTGSLDWDIPLRNKINLKARLGFGMLF